MKIFLYYYLLAFSIVISFLAIASSAAFADKLIYKLFPKIDEDVGGLLHILFVIIVIFIVLLINFSILYYGSILGL